MNITEITMTHFGKFHGKTMTFQPGINVIYGRNESGKSTIHTFIQGMFWGIEKQRGRASKNDVYSRYEPWDNQGGYGGVLRFEIRGISYRIERSFLKTDKWVRLIDETHGRELAPAQEKIEELLGGMNETSYVNTVSVAQMKAATDSGLADELKNYIANLNNAGNLEVDFPAAEGYLVSERRRLESLQDAEAGRRSVACREEMDLLEKQCMILERIQKQSAGQIREMEERRAALLRDADGRDAVHRETLRQMENKRAQMERELEQMTGGQEFRQRKNAAGPVLAALAVMAGILTVLAYFEIIPFWMNLTETLIAGGCEAAVFILGVALWIAHDKKARRYNMIFQHQEEIRRLDNACRAASERYQPADRAEIEKLDQELKQLHNTAGRAGWEQEKCQEERNRLSEELEELKQECADNEKRAEEIQALELAIRTMKELSGRIQNSFGSRLHEMSSQLLSRMTEGKYTDLVIHEDMSVYINTREKLIPLEQVSRGTMEQIYLAIRLAAAKVLWPEEPMPLLVDDLFVHYDDVRMQNTLKLLQEQENQLILFTCHRREEENLGM